MSASILKVQSATSLHDSTLQRQPHAKPAPRTGGTDGGKRKPSSEVLLASEQVCHLASLHHYSDYSRMKYGPNGASCIYIPMSIHVPDHVEHLKELQASRITQPAWWLSSRQPNGQPELPYILSKTEPVMTRAACSIDLKEDLHAALTSPLDTQPRMPPSKYIPQLQLRTSETHPINISTMIPRELLQMISTNLSHANQDLPVIFDVPSSCQLHRLLFRSHEMHRSSSPVDALLLPSPRQAVTLPSTPPRSLTTPSKSSSFVNLLWTQAFLRKSVVTSAFSNDSSKSFGSFRHSLVISSPASVIEYKSAISHKALDLAPVTSGLRKEPVAAPRDIALEMGKLPSNSKALKRNSAPSGVPSVNRRGNVTFHLGNLYLSSCPGKKVRLNGPVKGRGAVCRDLKQDLKRMSEMGVRCIVCCLDDSELEFLGAPWHEYSRTADELGLDVLRIQIPEGLVPLDIEAFDAHLTRLIDTYTLTGRHVLVHCRGGVGRAGLIACCWTVKLGLCGWIEAASQAGTAIPHVDVAPVKSDTLDLVQRVLTVVRKQRSPKAIETFEQVKFLADFVEYLRESAKPNIYSSQAHEEIGQA